MEAELRLEIDRDRVRATFDGDQDTSCAVACSKLVSHIATMSPRRVQIVCDFASPHDHWAKALAGKSFPAVTAFVFDTYFQTQTRQGTNSIGDLAASFGAFPQLARVFATGNLALSPFEHANVRALHLLGDPLSQQLLANLGASSFPKLDKLALSLASDAGPVPMDAAIAAIGKLRAPLLRELHLDGITPIEGALGALVDAVAGRVKELVLHGPIDDEDQLIEVLEAKAGALRAFDVLGLSLVDYVSTDAAEAAARHVPAVRDTDQIECATLPAAYETW
jgi:hypothetical protein